LIEVVTVSKVRLKGMALLSENLKINVNTRWHLSVMMFLQFMVLGSWHPVLSEHMNRLGFSSIQIATIYSLLPLACIITPFVGGQLGDRYVNTEKLLGVSHLISSLLLCVMARTNSYNRLLPLMFLWSLVYAPTTALINSITFHHLLGTEKRFSLVRVFGTLGWVASGLLLTGIRNLGPESRVVPWLGGADSLWLGGFISVLLGLYCFKLPYTPPIKSKERPWAFLSALSLLREPSTALFIAVFFIMSLAAMFYYVWTAPFLRSIGIPSKNIPAVLTIAQVAEIGTMLGLPWMLKRWGIRKTMVLGILAWAVRYAVFAYGQSTGLVIIALSLHGLCFVCFNVVSYIYVNSLATPDIRASVQALIPLASGTGRYVSSNFAGWIIYYYTISGFGTQVVNYKKVFVIPCAITTVCLILFFLTFYEKSKVSSES
jgi:nucleoside transporter